MLASTITTFLLIFGDYNGLGKKKKKTWNVLSRIFRVGRPFDMGRRVPFIEQKVIPYKKSIDFQFELGN